MKNVVGKSLLVRIISFLYVTFLLTSNSFSQIGPGNVGNSGGTNGQPELKFWLVADSLIAVNGDDVLNWNDISGNNNNFSAISSTSPIFRESSINGHDYVEFSKSNNRIVSYPFDIPSGTVTVFVVTRTTDSGDGLMSYATSSHDNEYLFYQSNDLQTFISSSSIAHGISYNDGDWKIFSHQWRNSDGQLLLHINGNELVNTNFRSGVSLQSNGALAIGGEQDGLNSGYTSAQDFKGDIAEFIMFGTTLNQAQRVVIENYLAQKYGLDANLPIDYFTPPSIAYVAGFSGMGKEPDGEAELNSNGFVVSGTNNFDDGEYLFAAHNGTENSINTSPSVLYSEIGSTWERNWYVEKTGTFDVRLAFDLSEGINGKYPANIDNYKLLYKANPGDSYDTITVSLKGVQNGDQIYFDVLDADLANGYYTLGTINETDSPLDGVEGRTWYTMISGDWDNWQIWTLDPSGMLPDNPGSYTPSTSPTNNADNVVIRSGNTIRVSTDNKSNALIRVDGRLDLTTTTNHNFGEIQGSGRILLEGDNFPNGDASHFAGAGLGEGTVVYYGTNYSLITPKELYNVEIDLTSTTNTITLLADYTINGSLRVVNGILQINDNTSTTALQIEIGEDINVLNNGQILTGQGNAYNQLVLKGDLINEGKIAFTNRTSADYNNNATDGVVELIANSDLRDQEIQCLGITNFYRIEINKGLDKTYILSIIASQSSYFNLFGYAHQNHSSIAQLSANLNALGLLRGTVKIGPNVNIPVLSNTGNYNISENARLWVDGGYVAMNSGNAIVPYGDLQISSGTMEVLVSSGVTMRDDGAIIVEGGTLSTNQIRTSVLGASHVGGYSQSGGETHLVGTSTNTDYYVFNLTYEDNVFNMSGGVLHIHEAHGKGGIFIASRRSNCNVTGGTVILEIDDNNDFPITSRAPFWNIIIRNSSGGNGEHILKEGVDVGATDVYLAAQPLEVLNDLTLESDSWFETEGNDVYIGRNFAIHNDAMYEFHENTTYFNGTNNGILYIGDITSLSNPSYTDPEGENPYAAWEQPFYGFTIDKPADAKLILLTPCTYDAGNTTDIKSGGCKNTNDWRSNLIKVTGPFVLESGKFDIGEYSVRLYGDITNKGIFGLDAEPVNALIKTRKQSTPTTRVITTTDGAEFGNLRLNSGEGIFEITSNVYVRRLEYKHGRLNIGKYNLKVDTLVFALNSSEVINNDFSVEDMIIMDGNASDGGLSIYVPQVNNPGLADPSSGNPSFNSTVYFFPIGTGTTGTYPGSKYTPANIRLASVSDDGYITVNIASKQLATAGPYPLGNDILNKYFRIRHDGFSTVPKVERFRFNVTEADLPDGTNDTEMLDDGFQTWSPGYVLDKTPYTRTAEINNGATGSSGFLNSGIEDIRIFFWGNTGSGNPTGGFDLIAANYTAGLSSKFVGEPEVFYTTLVGRKNWNDESKWSKTDDGVDDGNTGYPEIGDIAVIKNYGNNNHDAWVSVNQDISIAELVFDHSMGGYSPRAWVTKRDANLDLGRVSGEGTFFLEVTQSQQPTFSNSSDLGEFNDEANSMFDFYIAADNQTVDMPNNIDEYPNIRVEASNEEGDDDNRILQTSVPITVNGWVRLDRSPRLRINHDATVKGDLRVTWQENRTTLEIGDEREITLNIEGDLSLENGSGDDAARLIVKNDNQNGFVHTIKVGGDINLESNLEGTSVFDLYNGTGNNNNAILELNGTGNFSFNNLSPAVLTPDLYRVVINKGDDQTNTFIFNNNFILNGPTSGAGVNKALELQNGTLVLNHSDINIDLNTGDDDFEIPSTSALEVRQGQVNVSGDNTGILLDGKLSITGGNVDMISGPGNGNNYIEYSASGNAELEINSGQLDVGSQIRRALLSDIGVLKYTQTGGIVNVGVNAAPEGNRGVFEIIGNESFFTHSGGDFSIVRQQSSPTNAAFYLDPGNYSIASGTTINIGSSSTPAGQNIGITSTVPLKNIVINNSSANNPIATLWVSDLAIEEELKIDAGASLGADNFDLILKGNLTNNGTYIPNTNTTYFTGSSNQLITGNTDFYNLIKNSSNTLILDDSNAEIHILNELDLNEGVINDNNNSILVDGYCNMDAIQQHNGAGDGIVLQGSYQQQLTGNGTFGKLTINNPNNVLVPLGNEFTISDTLKMQEGIFYIGSNLLTLDVDAFIEEANPFSENNMIQTNISFTDNGVRKILPTGASDFIFPIGASGKYTPISLDISANTNSSGYLTVKAANEIHPSIIEDSESPDPEIVDADNVLQYHWVVNSDGISGLTANVDMQYIPTDVKVTSPYDVYDYITARLLNDGSGNWNKYDDTTTFDETNKLLHFTFTNAGDDEIMGDYTAGVDGSGFLGAIPNQVPFYESTMDGDWETGTVWDPNVSGGPRGSMVRVNSGDSIIVLSNYLPSYTTEVNGVANLNTTFGHRFGLVSGTGLIYTESEALPAGVYDDFFAANKGTLEYGGVNDYDVLAGITKVNNITFSGTGERRLPNQNLLVKGNFKLNGVAGLNVVNEHNTTITINGNLIHEGGNFDAGYGTNAGIVMQSSTNQTISGDFADGNALNILTINNSDGVNVEGDIDIKRELILTDGIITDNGNTFRINKNATISPSSGAVNSFIDGSLTKELVSGKSFIYPIADGINRGTVEIVNSTGFSGIQDFSIQYIYENPTDSGFDTEQYNSPINMVSESEYWTVQGIAGAQIKLSFTLDGSSDVANSTAINTLRIVGWNGTQWDVVGGMPVTSGTASSGKVTTSTYITLDGSVQYFTLGSTQLIPKATATIISGDVTICEGTSTNIKILLTGEQPCTLSYEENGSPQTISGITTNSYQLAVNPSVSTDYVLTSVSDNHGAGILAGNTDVTISVESVYAEASSTDADCYDVSNGSITIYNQAGGSGVYQYSINGGGDWYSTYEFINLHANNYNVMVRDAGTPYCEFVVNSSMVIDEPDEITASVSSLDEQCEGNNDGEISILGAIGGSGIYEYSISDGSIWLTTNTFSNLSPGTYEVWIRDKNESTCEIYLGTSIISQGITIDTNDIYRIPNE